MRQYSDLMRRKLSCERTPNPDTTPRAFWDKVESINTTKAQEEMEEEEAWLCETVEERRAHKNNRSKERNLEKKLELERVMAMLENERTKEEQ